MAVLDFPSADINEHLKEYEPSVATATARFRFWHVESLLNQAADLLDRCLAEQVKYDSLRAQALTVVTNLRAEEEPLAIEEIKRDNGVYDFPLTDATFKRVTLDGLKPLEDASLGFLTSIDILNQKAETKATEVEKERARLEIRLHNISQGRWGMERELTHREETRQAGALGQVAMQKLLLRQGRVRLEEKRSGMKDNGPWDFSAQADRSLQRILRDHNDAVERLLVASDGLFVIYGYAEAFPPQPSLTAFDDAVEWVREAIRWLAAFSQKDQTFTVTVSLRRLLGANWADMQAEDKELSFRMDPYLFDGHRYVRLRGLSTSLRLASNAPLFPLRCVVAVPRKARFVRIGQDGKDDPIAVDQTTIPPCTLGRVVDGRVPLEPEVCGAISLMNASPLGETDAEGMWSIRVQGITEDPLTWLEDILLEARVTGQPVPR